MKGCVDCPSVPFFAAMYGLYHYIKLAWCYPKPMEFKHYPVLKELYIFKKKPNRYILLKTLSKKRARRYLLHFLALVAKLNESPFKNTGSNIRALDRADNCLVEIQ